MSTLAGDRLRYLIVDIINEESPSTVDGLVDIIQSRVEVSTETILEELTHLYEEKLVDLIQPPPNKPDNIITFALSSDSYWFWLNSMLSILFIVW